MYQRATDPCFLKAMAHRNIKLAMKLERHCNFQDSRDIVYMQRARNLYDAALDDLNAAIKSPNAIDHKNEAVRQNTEETMNDVKKYLRRFEEMAKNYRFLMMKMDDALQLHLRFLDRVAGVGNDNRYVCNCPELFSGVEKLAMAAADCQAAPSKKIGDPTGKVRTDSCKEDRTAIVNMICDAYRIELENYRSRLSITSDASTCGSVSDLAQPTEGEGDREQEK